MSENLKIKSAKYDVIVVGGGLSGMCAAIAASRNGAKTALIQARHILGGNASSEIRMHICGASENMMKPQLEEGGILYEMMLENKSINHYFNYSTWDMVLYSAVKKQKNLMVYLNTVMDDCTMQDDRIISITAYQQTTETRWNFTADIYIDCTGNGTLGFLAGAEFRIGSESKYEFDEPHAPEKSDNNRMGNTLLFKAVDRGCSVNFKRPDFARVFTEKQLKYRTHSAYHKPETKGTVDDKYLKLASLGSAQIDYGYWWIELSGKTDDIIDEYEQIRDELVECIYGIWDHLKNGGEHGAENYDLEWVGMMPGMRESISLELEKAEKVSQVRLTFDSNFNYSIKLTMSSKRQKQQRIGIPPELVRDYTVSLWFQGEKVNEKNIRDNIQRHNIVDFEETLCDKVMITVNATNGHENARIFEIRVY